MADATNEQSIWSLQGNLAELNCNNLSGRIDTAHPHAGLREPAMSGQQVAAVFLGVHRVGEGRESGWPLQLADAYVRGSDLVATYHPTNDWPFSPQLYWRANAFQSVDGVLASLSLLVSVQTYLLDTCPQIGVATQLPRGELFLVSMGGSERVGVYAVKQTESFSPTGATNCVVARLKDRPLSYVEVMPPEDYHDVVLRPECDRISFEWRLFADFLEKGVIRRARVFAALLPRKNDIELAASCCEAIERLDLPLTT